MNLTYEEATELYYILCDKLDDMRETEQDTGAPEQYAMVSHLCDMARSARYA